MSVVLRTRGLRKTYGNIVALNHGVIPRIIAADNAVNWNPAPR